MIIGPRKRRQTDTGNAIQADRAVRDASVPTKIVVLKYAQMKRTRPSIKPSANSDVPSSQGPNRKRRLINGLRHQSKISSAITPLEPSAKNDFSSSIRKLNEAFEELVDRHEIEIERALESLEREKIDHSETKSKLWQSEKEVDELNLKLQASEREVVKSAQALESTDASFQRRLREKDQSNMALQTKTKEKDQSIDALQKQIDEKNQSIEAFQVQVSAKDYVIASLEAKGVENSNKSAKIQEEHLSTIDKLQTLYENLKVKTEEDQHSKSLAEQRYFSKIYHTTFNDVKAIRDDLKIAMKMNVELESHDDRTIGELNKLSKVPYMNTEEALTKVSDCAVIAKKLLRREQLTVSYFCSRLTFSTKIKQRLLFKPPSKPSNGLDGL